MNDGWSRFNDQFRETVSEQRERWRKQRAKRVADGKCWQCAKPTAECTCPNIKRTETP
jgi:hypothetical protein